MGYQCVEQVAKVRSGKLMKAVLFDFDGTIADTLPLIFHAFRKVFSKYTGRTYSDREILQMFGPPEKEIIERHIPPKQRKQAFRDFLQLYDDKHREMVEHNPDIEKVVRLIKEKGLSLGIVTGKGRDSANISLRHLGLARFFDVTITGDDVVRPKPDPEGLLMAINRLGVRPADAMYVGDSNGDILAGRRAGTGTIGANWMSVSQSDGFSVQPDHIFKDIQSFYKWIQSGL